MNTEDDEFERIEREQAMRGVPDAIHHTDPGETLEYITGWNDCRQAMLEQSDYQDPIGDAQDKLIAEQAAMPAPVQQEPVAKVRTWHGWNGDQHAELDDWGLAIASLPDGMHNLYTTPQAQRKPLTVSEVEQILAQHNYEIHGDRARYIVRMTEAAHGIKENQS